MTNTYKTREELEKIVRRIVEKCEEEVETHDGVYWTLNTEKVITALLKLLEKEIRKNQTSSVLYYTGTEPHERIIMTPKKKPHD